MSVIQNISAKLKIFQYIQSDNLNPSIFFPLWIRILQKFSTMDPEQKNNESQKKDPDSCTDPSNVFQSSRLRRFIRSCDEVDRVLLGY
jgi:hypothetical protein